MFNRTAAVREDGASATEYGLLISLIATVMVISLLVFGDLIGDMFTGACSEMDEGTTLSADCS